MPNIYLRLPFYACAFYRGLEEDYPKSEFDPIPFVEYSHEYVFMADNVRLIPEQTQSALCYSQRAWNNILNGRKPDGGKQMLVRDPKEWPSVQDLCTLTGKKMSDKVWVYDYLCINLPRIVFHNRKQVPTNDGYSLSFDMAKHFSHMLCQEFYHVALDWMEQDLRNCNRNGIKRTKFEIAERFFTQYNIPLAVDSSDRESLRRLFNRLLKKAKKRPNDRINFQQGFLDYVSDDEMSGNGHNGNEDNDF